MAKNPIWQEVDMVCIYRCFQGVELGSTDNNASLVVRVGLEPATSGLIKSNAVTTLPRCLQKQKDFWTYGVDC